MSDSTEQNEVQSQEDPPRQDISNTVPEIHLSKISLIFLSDDTDNYTQLDDEYMESKGCEIFVEERDHDVSVRFRGQVKAIVGETGHFQPETKEELHYGFWQFQSPEDMKIWTACILADVAYIKSSRLQDDVQLTSKSATFRSQTQPVFDVFVPPKIIPVKRKRDETQLADGQSSTSLQAQFLQQRQQYSKFNSLADQKIAQDLIRTFEGFLWKPASKIDMLSLTLEPLARQKLNEDISWNGANIIFPTPEVGTILKEEGPGYARRSLESSAAVTQGMAMLINDAARNETDNIVRN
ncbi:MAG: hypothetical protein EZS28_025720, partial [Streblomastix strix]